MRAYERFLKYAKIHTTSAEERETTPSTPCQWDLAKVLVDELKDLGMENPGVDDNCIVTAWLSATPGCENAPALGFLAHMDTAPAFSGENVHPVLHENYDGGDIPLPREGRVIRCAEFPFLAGLKGKTVITADGSTLLGADDKAGVAEIMTLCERLIQEGLPHGRICVAFTPDEEIGEGPDHFDVAAFGAKYAYTVDGGAAGSIEYENFNAASARVDITGVSVHPGSAKGIMENALLIAQQLNSLLPPDAIPAKTDGYEGFFHLDRLEGDVAFARMDYIIRYHDRAKFEEKKALMEQVAAKVRAAHPTARVELTIQDSYYNMKEQLEDCMHLVDNAKKAAEMAGVQPQVEPIRGGTDGARLSYMGLPCPNLGTGGYNFHGPLECVAAEDMDKVVDILCHIVSLYRP
ncbi:MAG TPA: peptidase T [Candidatus Enterenecus stercoripullorum]|nr:peptidase T [Candidatus Enterenecus stercoripullorum]